MDTLLTDVEVNSLYLPSRALTNFISKDRRPQFSPIMFVSHHSYRPTFRDGLFLAVFDVIGSTSPGFSFCFHDVDESYRIDVDRFSARQSTEAYDFELHQESTWWAVLLHDRRVTAVIPATDTHRSSLRCHVKSRYPHFCLRPYVCLVTKKTDHRIHDDNFGKS